MLEGVKRQKVPAAWQKKYHYSILKNTPDASYSHGYSPECLSFFLAKFLACLQCCFLESGPKPVSFCSSKYTMNLMSKSQSLLANAVEWWLRRQNPKILLALSYSYRTSLLTGTDCADTLSAVQGVMNICCRHSPVFLHHRSPSISISSLPL